MPDETILLAIYKENADQARQHEVFRQTITTLVAGITGAVIGLLSLKETAAVLHSPLLPVAGIFLAVIGTFGLIASMKHYERNRMHVERIREIRKALDALPGIKAPNLLRAAPPCTNCSMNAALRRFIISTARKLRNSRRLAVKNISSRLTSFERSPNGWR